MTFNDWWAKNHPFDWWAKERGESLPHHDRLLVRQLCQRAFESATPPTTDVVEPPPCPGGCGIETPHWLSFHNEDVVLVDRERAAKVAEAMAMGETYETGRQKAINIAAAIRALPPYGKE